MRRKMFAAGIVLAMLMSFGSSAAFATHRDTHAEGREGDIHITKKVRVGDSVLGPGMYRVRHVASGGDHFMVFRKLNLPAGYRRYAAWPGKEVARVMCEVVPLGGKVRKTEVQLSDDETGVKRVEGVLVRGEDVKHVIAG